MSERHPYIGLPDRQFWNNDPGIADRLSFDPVAPPPFVLSKDEPIVTGGSCFAQHVARYLGRHGFNHLVTEPAHPMFRARFARQFGYGLFAARYGNIYTARQLSQLLLRAYGEFEPIETCWPSEGSRVVDPFRPQIQPRGFVSEAELRADREVHFAAIREAIETMTTFVFTLGLTECWADRRDGAIYPLAPGIAGGNYDPQAVAFHNFGVEETTQDLLSALRYIRAKNPGAKVILTVSPVPLNATMENRHVFVSTTWSKAVLRIAAETTCATLDRCVYFPSYEIITSPHVRSKYYGEDRRAVTEPGVQHVMRLFFRHFAPGEEAAAAPVSRETKLVRRHMTRMAGIVEALCDEEAIDNR